MIKSATLIVLLLNLFKTISCDQSDEDKKPNIVIITADDLGFNDVSFRGSTEIPTPNIDSLCYNGVILNRFYTPPLCTPSRSSLMTGKYSTRLGMQHFVIISDEPWGLPLEEKLLPQYFKEAGYQTALIGKWHLGFHEKRYTPTFRGFDSHFGYLGPYISYYDHSLIMLDRNYSRGYDMRRNLQMTPEMKGKYATDLFTDEAVNLIHNHDVRKPLFLLLNHLAPHTGNEDKPLEAPAEVIKKFEYIKDEKRRTLAAMISVMDEGIGKVVKAIKDKGILENTIIMFLSDNGGPTQGIHSTMASNHPLRGQKGGVFEGGCRVPACVYSPLIKNNRRISEEFMYITDILPTMTSAAGIRVNTRNLDGVDQWQVISESLPSIRREILYNIENVLEYSAVMSDGWKLVNGSENLKNSVWLGDFETRSNISMEEYVDLIQESDAAKSLPQLTSQDIKNLQINSTIDCNSQKINKCNTSESPCLFNIVDDPCERNNLARERPDKVKFLLSRLSHHITEIKPSLRQLVDPNCDPKFYNYEWTWWIDIMKEREEENSDIFYILSLFLLICAIMISLPFVIVKYSKKRWIKK